MCDHLNNYYLALLLNIDTATEYAGVCISNDENVLSVEESADQKNHGAFIQPAIQKLSHDLAIDLRQLDAIAVSGGPGSYTGLRVGVATAKGLCYALQKPLIMINTLEAMAHTSVIALMKTEKNLEEFIFSPMIDARRMEVFTALFDGKLNYIRQSTALILTEIPGDFFPVNKTIVFSGSGNTKMQGLNFEYKSIFQKNNHSVKSVAALAFAAFQKNKFTELAYSEPIYVKEFFTPPPVKKIKNLL